MKQFFFFNLITSNFDDKSSLFGIFLGNKTLQSEHGMQILVHLVNYDNEKQKNMNNSKKVINTICKYNFKMRKNIY